MKLLLTSFGTSHLEKGNDNVDMFYKMPPVSMSAVGQQFMPDYTTLLLANKIIVDSQTYDRLTHNPHSSYNAVAKMIKSLYDEGFIQIEDFDVVIQNNKPLLEKMLERDLKSLDLWVKPLKESSLCWRDFVSKFYGELRDDYIRTKPKSFMNYKLRAYMDIYDETDPQEYSFSLSHNTYRLEPNLLLHLMKHSLDNNFSTIDEILNSSAKRKKSANREKLKRYLTGYLSHVNTNILLSQIFETGFHDWYDYKPFYQEKFLNVAKESSPGGKEIENIKKLFEISFPEFSFWQPDNVLKALKDKRIQELRQLIDSACKREVEFDREFANRILLEVFKIGSKMTKFRNIVSYLTMPLGFIPAIGTPIQKATEELITKPRELKRKKGFQWFYMISELAHKPINEE